jgi:hypothetical protein
MSGRSGRGFPSTLVRVMGLKAENLTSDFDGGLISLTVTDNLVGREKFSMERDIRNSEGLYGDFKPSLGGGWGRGGVVGRSGMASVVGDVGSTASPSTAGRIG